MVASRKIIQKSIKHNNNYVFRLKRSKDEAEMKQNQVKRRSNLFDIYSVESQQVERRKKTNSASNADRVRPTSLNINAIQEICMVDIKTQLMELTKRVNKLIETTETRLSRIENKLMQPP